LDHRKEEEEEQRQQQQQLLDGWWHSMSQQDQEIHESCWRRGYRLWYDTQDYLEAMKCFQDSLAPLSNAWEIWTKRGHKPLDSPTSTSTTTSTGDTTALVSEGFRLELAKRLLFCAYCEIDGQSIDLGRQHLVQCLSLLLLLEMTPNWTDARRTTWDDAWMELILSLEEAEDQQHFAKIVAALALDKNQNDSVPRPCGWTNAWQRPGFMSGHVRSHGDPGRCYIVLFDICWSIQDTC
jgi:hypothetical protein